jgi:alanine dehydrogenase
MPAPPATLVLTRADVLQLLTLPDSIVAVEEAFRQHALGTALPPAVLGVHAEHGTFHIKAAGVLAPTPVFAAKVNGNFPANRARFALPTIQGVIVLADLTNGTPLAIMDSIEITMQRTGAATAVAAQYLTDDGPKSVGIVGCGLQGRIQLRSLSAVRPLTDVRAYDIDHGAAQRFAAEMSAVLGVRVTVVAHPREAVADRDLVATCTTSGTPIIRPGDVRAGTFIAAVGADNPEKHEIDSAVLASATVIADVLEQSATIGDLHHALVAGVMQRSDVHAELGDVVVGRKPPRRSTRETVVFDSTGMALQDVVVAALVHQRAVAQGVGLQVALTS